MYRRYKREQEQLQQNRTVLEKSKVKSEKPKKPPETEVKQKQDASTTVSPNLKTTPSQKIQFQEKSMSAGPNKESDTLLKKRRRKVNKKVKKKKRRRLFDCFKVCIRKKKSSDQSAEEATILTDRKSATSLQPTRIKSSESSKRTTPRSDVPTTSKSSIKTEPSNDGLAKDKLNLKISSELYGVKKIDEAEPSDCSDQKSNSGGIKKLCIPETKEETLLLVKTEKPDIKKKKDLQKKSTVKTEIPEVQIKQEVSGDPKKSGKSNKESSAEKKSAGFLSSKSKKDEKTEKWKDQTEVCCPLCLQNAATVTSLYASEMNKDANSLHVSINNYYTDKWQKQIQQTMVRPKTRTVQTSVRPRSRNAATNTDERPLNKTSDNVRYLECTDEKITVCRSRRN